MNTRTRSFLSAVLVGVMGVSIAQSSRGDYVEAASYLGGAYQQDFNYYGVSLVGAAYGVFQDYINVGFVGFQLQTNYSNIQSITVSGSVSPYLSAPFSVVGIPTSFEFYQVSSQIANLATVSYLNNTLSEELFNGLNSGIPGLGGGLLIAAGQTNFSITVTDPVAIAETIAVAQSDGGFIGLGISSAFGQGLNVLNSASIDVHYGITPQSVVPEPASITLACLGGAGIAVGRRLVKRRG